MKRSIFGIVLLFVFVYTANGEDLNDAGQILKKVELKYQSLNSYSDNGVVETPAEIISFKTKFAKPNYFKFNWSSKINITRSITTNSAIWSDGDSVYSYYSYNNKIETEDELSMAIAGATGVSSAAAHNIPSLLGLTSGIRITNISLPVLIGESIVEQELCYHIKGKGHNEHVDVDIFISKQNSMIRKIKKTTPIGTTETLYLNVSTNPPTVSSEYNLKPECSAFFDQNNKKSLRQKTSEITNDILAYLKAQRLSKKDVHEYISKTEVLLLPSYDKAIFEYDLKWTISDPFVYYKNVDEKWMAESRIDDFVYDAIRFVLYTTDVKISEDSNIAQEVINRVFERFNQIVRDYEYGIVMKDFNLKLKSVERHEKLAN